MEEVEEEHKIETDKTTAQNDLCAAILERGMVWPVWVGRERVLEMAMK